MSFVLFSKSFTSGSTESSMSKKEKDNNIRETI